MYKAQEENIGLYYVLVYYIRLDQKKRKSKQRLIYQWDVYCIVDAHTDLDILEQS